MDTIIQRYKQKKRTSTTKLEYNVIKICAFELLYPILLAKRRVLLKNNKDFEKSNDKLSFITLPSGSVHPYKFDYAPITAKELIETIDYVFISFCVDYT